MVLVMESDGTLRPSQRQDRFARTYTDGIGLGSATDDLKVLGEKAATVSTSASLPAPRVPKPHILAAIEETALRYAGHRGLRAADITVTTWINLYRANIEIESGYNPHAVSRVGAIGLGQLMPETARVLGVDPRDWQQNLTGSAQYLAMMLAEFGDVRLALAAYNAGPEAVRKHAGIPPFTETRNHVQRVLAVVHRLEGASQ